MNKVFHFFLLFSGLMCAQNVSQRLEHSVQKMMNSRIMYSGNLSFYVQDENGKEIYNYQGNKGLSTASTQKIFTSMYALDKLGKDFRYKTTLSYSGEINQKTLKGNLYLTSDGDPTLGSWRYDGYRPEDFLNKVKNELHRRDIQTISGDLVIDDSYFDFQTIPGGWPWNDIGNYYGAGVFGVNWRENQFDVIFQGKEMNQPAKLKSLKNISDDYFFVNETETGASHIGDQSILYSSPHGEVIHINGKLPAKTIKVSGSVPNPSKQLARELVEMLKSENIQFLGKIVIASEQQKMGKVFSTDSDKKNLLTYQSPSLKDIIHWFLRKSVNLYGETLMRTVSKIKIGHSSFQASVELLKKFWEEKGIHPAMINFIDGSGLSPQNYASAKAEVQALIWAKNQPWFDVFYEALPLYNEMKMKRGTIKSTKAYAGYHTSKNGQKYIFSIIVNNYDQGNINSYLFDILNNLK